MKRLIRRVIVIAEIAFLIYIGFMMVLLFVFNFSFPTSETLAHWYLEEMTHGTSAELQTPFLRCPSLYLEQDRALYGGAEVQNVHVESIAGTGSSDTVRFLTVTFEYRLPDTSEWQLGNIDTLMTDFEPLRARRLSCVV